MDLEAVKTALSAKHIFFFEEGIRAGGIGERFGDLLLENGFKGQYTLTAVPDEFVIHATDASQMKRYRLDAEGMLEVISEKNDG